MEALARLAAEWGVDTSYIDGHGRRREVDWDTLRRIVEIASRDRLPRGRVPPAIVFRAGRGRPAAVHDAESLALIDWAIVSGDRVVARRSAGSGTSALPEELPVGTFGLDATLQSGAGEAREHAILLVAPPHAYSGEAFGGAKVWALGVQLYGVRSRRNWGHGDFTDLMGLLDLAADLGAAGVGLNPLHALFTDDPERASPYSPNSRLFLNPLYIDVEVVPEFAGAAAGGLIQEIARLRAATTVDYAGVAAAKLAALRSAFASFRREGSAQRRDDFEAFRREQGRALDWFVSFEILRRRFGSRWAEWPAVWRRPEEGALAELRRSTREEFEFEEFVQWVAGRQLRACARKAQILGMPLGLYFDVAVGVDPAGADAWAEQDTMLAGGSIGAPPDLLNTAGQNWSLVTFNPRALEQHGFDPFRRVVTAAMRYAGAIRLDHVLGLNRLYFIPDGATDGSYIRCPFEAMLTVVAQESVAHRCVVIGEDLGTVPANLRETLADWGVWSYRVMLFEREHDGSFRLPQHYAENALVTFSTHDLATFVGWLDGRDLREKRALGIDPGESEQDRERARAALQTTLARWRGKRRAQLGFLPVAGYLAATPSRILVISMEDALGVAEQPNVPGTIAERANWRHRLPVALEDLPRHPQLRALARVLRRSGRSIKTVPREKASAPQRR
jgi:4-alpha-glucanotransferase